MAYITDMIIKYFRITEDEKIHRCEIKTSDREYHSHTDEVVFINEGFGRPKQYNIKFEGAKKDLVYIITKRLVNVQQLTEESLDFL